MKRKYIYLILSLLVVVLIVLFNDLAKYNDMSESQNIFNEINIETLPRIELLAGVLSQTSWMDERGPQGKGNKYFQELQLFFSEYKEHEAIKVAEELTQKGFAYDAPINFIFSLSELPKLNSNGYSNYLVMRAGDEEILEKFRVALIDLANESNFLDDFYKKNINNYNRYMDLVGNNFDRELIVKWMEDFYGYLKDEYHMVITPGMFPVGGHGAIIKKNNKEVVYQLVRETGISEGEPEFQKDIPLLALHEWGHSFINPAVEQQKDKIDFYNLQKFFVPVEEIMGKQAYNNVYVFLNEQILRAVTIIAIRDMFKTDLWANQIEYHKDRGFYLTEFTIEQIDYYIDNRDKYKTFNEFIPYILLKYHENEDILLSLF